MDRELGLPAEAAHFPAIEEDEGVIADPALLAAGVFEAGVEPELVRDPADGVGELAVAGNAEVKDADFLVGFVESDHDGVDAVLDVEVAFALGAIAEDAEVFGVFEELFVKIEDVAVGVAFAENGDEAKDDGADAEAFGVGGDEAFGGEFGGAVEGGLDGEGAIFRCRDAGGDAVDGAGAGKSDGFDAIAAHAFEDVPGDDNVLVEVSAGVVCTEADVGVGGEVDDDVDADTGFDDAREVEEVAFDQLELGGGESSGEEFPLAGDIAIETDHFVAVGEQTIDDVTADESGGSSD